MSFVDPAFVFLFAPLTLGTYYVLVGFGQGRALVPFLVAASLLFYSYWSVPFTGFLIALITANYLAGTAAYRVARGRRLVFGVIIAANLLVLGYFKYRVFFLSNLFTLSGRDFEPLDVILPLGISFITFQKIAWHVDLLKRRASPPPFWRFALFASFFPQLIAGPIVHHSEVMDQFGRLYQRSRSRWKRDLAIGLSIFAVGLFKKVMLADSFAVHAQTVFDGFADGRPGDSISTALGMLAYSLQIYFDFSGYSDMAIGLARLFGVRFPLNFLSPYKARSIAEFWRRWHMTLSRFLRDHLYIPLGGNRRGRLRQHVNLFTTMLLGGLWHGANWTFVVWGALHGIYLIVGEKWRRRMAERGRVVPRRLRSAAAWLLTFGLVTLTWTFFRAENLAVALDMIGTASGQASGYSFHPRLATDLPALADLLAAIGAVPAQAANVNLLDAAGLLQFAVGLGVVLILPSTAELFRRYGPVIDWSFEALADRRPALDVTFRLQLRWALFIGVLLFVSFAAILQKRTESEFIYFQF